MPMFRKSSKRIVQMFNRQRGLKRNKNYRKEEPIPFDPSLMGRLKSHADTAREKIARQHALSTRVVLLPDGGYRAIWDCICIVALGYTFLEIPYALVFLDTSCLWEARDIINLICDCIFLFDVCLNFNTAYYDENLVLVDDHKKIFVRYVSTWCILDLVSSMPMERIVCAGGSDSSGNQSYLRFFKILRLVKMLRLLRFLRVIKKWEMLSGSGFVSRAIRLFKFANFLIFCAHVCGCFWMLIVSEECLIPGDERPDFSTTCGCEGPDCYRWNWLERYDPELAANGTPESKYLASLYFSIVTLSTVGFGDITPTNDAERMYSIFLALTGAVVFAFCIGSISSLATEGNKTETMIDEKIKEITDFLRFRRLPRTVEAKVRKDLFHASAKAPHLFHPCLDILPRYIRTEVFDFIMADDTGKIPMFNNMDSDCRAHITALLRPISLNSQEYLYRALDSADEMYFVTNGVLEEWDLEGSRIISKCSVGDIVGEMNMFVDPEIPVRLSSVRSRTKAELLVLNRADFLNEIKPHFPDVYLAIRDLALEQLQYVDLDKVAAKMCERSTVRCSGFTHQRAHFIKMMEEVRKVHLLDPSLVTSVARAAYRHKGDALSSVKTASTLGNWTALPEMVSTRSNTSSSPVFRAPMLPFGAGGNRRRSLVEDDPRGMLAESPMVAPMERFFGERGALVGDDGGGSGHAKGNHAQCAAMVEASISSLKEEVSQRLNGLEQNVNLMLRAMAAAHGARNSFDVLALYGKPDPALRASEALAAAAAQTQRPQLSSPFSSVGPSSPKPELRDGTKDDFNVRPSRHTAAKDESAMAKQRSNSYGDIYHGSGRTRIASLGLPKVDEKHESKLLPSAGSKLSTANGVSAAEDDAPKSNGVHTPHEIEEAGKPAHAAAPPCSGQSHRSGDMDTVAERGGAGVTEAFGPALVSVVQRGDTPRLATDDASPTGGVAGPDTPATQDNPKPSDNSSPVVGRRMSLAQSILEFKGKDPPGQARAEPNALQEGGLGRSAASANGCSQSTPPAEASRAMLPPSPGQLPPLRKRNPFF